MYVVKTLWHVGIANESSIVTLWRGLKVIWLAAAIPNSASSTQSLAFFSFLHSAILIAWWNKFPIFPFLSRNCCCLEIESGVECVSRCLQCVFGELWVKCFYSPKEASKAATAFKSYAASKNSKKCFTSPPYANTLPFFIFIHKSNIPCHSRCCQFDIF